MRYRLFITLLLLQIAFVGAMGYPKKITIPIPPADLPTIEALMELHKKVAKAEEESKKKLSAATIIRTETKKATNKFYDVREELNSKLDAGYQWVALAGGLSRLSLQIMDLTKDYVAYTKFFAEYGKKKPAIAFQYASCNYMVYKKVKLIEKSMATLAASNFNLFKCTMKERMQLIWDLQSETGQIQGIINNSYWYARALMMGGFHYDFIWDILTSEVTDQIATDVINQWNNDAKKWPVNDKDIYNI